MRNVSIILVLGVVSIAGAAHADDGLAQWIDGRFALYYEQQSEPLPDLIDDATFLRRVYLDLVGRIPSVAEVRDFQADSRVGKRQAVVDRLLETEQYGLHMARVWRRVLMPPTAATSPASISMIEDWLNSQFADNVPYDDIARRLIVAGGADRPVVDGSASVETDANGNAARVAPVLYLQSTGGQPASMASSVSRVFLGVRLECAQCHDHPFTHWKQKDFWGVAAFFAGARLNANGPDESSNTDARTLSISDQDGTAYTVSLPWFQGELQIDEETLPRQYFAKWLTSPENPQFAATAVNRIWQHFCGVGLTDSVDELDQADDAVREIVLNDLAAKFAEGGFDTQALIRAIGASRHYQQPTRRPDSGPSIATRPLKVLTPEQLFDSLEVALALPISSIDRGPRFNGLRDAMVARMEEAIGTRPDDFRGGIPQVLALMNGKITADATDLSSSRTLAAVVDAPFLDAEEKIDTLFQATLSRPAHKSELERLTEHVASAEEPAEAYTEIMWALINSPEFILVR